MIMSFKGKLTLAVALCGVALFRLAAGQTTGAAPGSGGELRRQAFLGVALSTPAPPNTWTEVRRITNPAAAEKTGLRVGDRILSVNGKPLDSFVAFQRLIPSLRANEKISLEILRGGQRLTLNPTPAPLPQEQHKGVEMIYDSAATGLGFRVRTIITRPQNAPGKLPAVFLVGWLSCDSVEHPFGPGGDGFGQLLQDIATRSGHVLIRMDKPGVGDSEGPSCADLDFETELASYRAAFKSLKRFDFIDPQRIFILGLSNGAAVAPLVPQAEKVRGYIVAGGWAKTWFEHMMELERRRLQLSGKSPGEITDSMKGFAEFYTDYLIRKMTPHEATEAKPKLASLWYDRPEHQYGRPAKFYHQLQDLNLAAAWATVDAPVFVMWGEYDWIMSLGDHEMIVDLINSRHPGRARLARLPRTDHTFMTFGNPESAFNDDASSGYNASVTEMTLKFLEANK